MNAFVFPDQIFSAKLQNKSRRPDITIGKLDQFPNVGTKVREYEGEWSYNTDWKMIYSPPVTMGWVNAITEAQRTVRRKGPDMYLPLLVMHSSRKIDGCQWTPEFQTGDCVLDPFQIRKIGVTLGQPDTRKVCAIDSGLHDLILSRPHVREAAYDTIFMFIR